jgi:ATP-dependent Lhr-like helicase
MDDAGGIKVIYITPLRALNRDLLKRLEDLCHAAGITISVRHGDTLQSERRKQVKTAPIFLLTTPETLQSILPTKSFSQHLEKVKFIVVDEVHELYSNKRGAMLTVALERLSKIAPDFCRIGISATISDPKKIGLFLCNKKPFKIAMVNQSKKLELKVEMPKYCHESIEDMSNKFGLDAPAVARLTSIANHISKSKSALIFANTRQVVEALGSRLVYMNKIKSFGGIGVHHSSLDKTERIKIENEFKTGAIKSIIATSSLELGIDVGSIDLVIQYGSPRQSLRLAQRMGRSGHTELGTSRGVIITVDEVDALESCAVYKNLKSGTLESFNLHENALDVLCHQICGIVLKKSPMLIDEVYSIVTGAFPYRNLKNETLNELLDFMCKQHLIGFDGKLISAGSKTRMYYYDHLGMINDTKKILVKNIVDNRVVSLLDEKFVASSLEEGSVFISKGLTWKVISIDENVISAEPSEDLMAAVPDWTGEDIPISYEVSHSVMKVLDDIKTLNDLNCLNKDVYESCAALSINQKQFGLSVNNVLFIENFDEYKVLHTPIGTMANEALARLITHMLAVRLGKSIVVKVSPYFILVEVPNSIDIADVIKSIKTDNIKEFLEEAVKDTELFRYWFVTVARFFGIIDKNATISKSITKRIIKVLDGTPVYKETIRGLINNYFDVNNLIKFIDEVRTGYTRIHQVSNAELSPLPKLILNGVYYTRELIMPLIPSSEVIESFSRFLLKKEINLVCTYCGFVFKRSLVELKDQKNIRCEACGSPMICRYNEQRKSLIDRKLSIKKIPQRDKILFKQMMDEASLFDTYGGRAAVALSTYGVGPRSASKALLMMRNEDSLFYTDLIEAQKQFIRTKKYWSLNR